MLVLVHEQLYHAKVHVSWSQEGVMCLRTVRGTHICQTNWTLGVKRAWGGMDCLAGSLNHSVNWPKVPHTLNVRQTDFVAPQQQCCEDRDVR